MWEGETPRHNISLISNLCGVLLLFTYKLCFIYTFFRSYQWYQYMSVSLPIVFFSALALGYGLDDRGFESRQGLGIFPFTTKSRPAVGPTQPHIQGIIGALFLGLKRPGSEAHYLHPSSAEVEECVELYFLSPSTALWGGAPLRRSTGTTLPYARQT